MNLQQEILKRINILIYQIAETIARGGFHMEWVNKSSDEIDVLIEELKDKEVE